MNEIHLVTMTCKGNPVYRFAVANGFDRASYLAGQCLDRLADYHGDLGFDYQVEAVPYVASMTPDIEVVRAALEIAV